MIVEVFTALTGVATLLLVAMAGWQLWALRQEAKRDRRPYLFVVVDKGRTRDGKDALYLSFTNYGKTPATHVRAKITEPVWKQLNNRTLAFERDSGILLLAPGATTTYFIGPASRELLARYSGEEGVGVNLEYMALESPVSYHESCEVTLLDRYGATKRD